MAWYLVITYKDGTKVKSGPLGDRVRAEQAYIGVIARPDVLNVEIAYEPDVPIAPPPDIH